MDRLETRELAYFLAVADELHFGRAATRLGIAQPALSKTVRQLERRLGVILFERTSRAVALTEAGQVLSREARVVLAAVSAAALRTQRAGIRDPRLVLAMKPGGDAGLLPAILAAYEREPELAITAIAHTLLKIAYGVLKTGKPYADLGADFYARRESPDARQDYLMRQLQKLNPGCAITITPRRPPDRAGHLNVRPRPRSRPAPSAARCPPDSS